MSQNAMAQKEIKSFFMPLKLKKRGGHSMVLVPQGKSLYEELPSSADPTLVKAIVRAHLWQRELDKGMYKTMKDLAEAHGVTIRYVQLLLPLTALSPQLIEAILRGTQPRHLKLVDLLGKEPPLWKEQEELWSMLTKSQH